MTTVRTPVVETSGDLIIDRLNTEWSTLATRTLPTGWRIPSLACCASLGDAAELVEAVRRRDVSAADAVLLEVLTRHRRDGDELAGRLVLQVMLGRAVNLARRAHRPGAGDLRGNLAHLSSLAVVALWTAIATYPIDRRHRKVAVNLCMDALGHFTRLLEDDVPRRLDLSSLEPLSSHDSPPAAVELLAVLVWGVDAGVISRDEATLLTRVYCPAPGDEGGAPAVARSMALTPATVRQRCRRAAHRLAVAVKDDAPVTHSPS